VGLHTQRRCRRIDVERVLRQARQRRAGEHAAERDHQPVVAECLRPALREGEPHLTLGCIDLHDFGFDALDADRLQHVVEK
jgi:hypothetical protein